MAHLKASSGFKTQHLEDQSRWHGTFRDSAKNMYRTSYTDMSHGNEVCVKSDHPSGYGGHVPSVRHDILFRNTVFDQEIGDRRRDPNRDAFPGFQDQISGVPTYTRFPQGAKRTPTYGVTAQHKKATSLKPPWGVLSPKEEPLNHRMTPRTTPLTTPRSPAHGGRAVPTGVLRTNEAARATGTMLASPGTYELTPRHPAESSLIDAKLPDPSPTMSEKMRQSVRIAQEEAECVGMPSEAEMLQGNLHS